ncbi:MAG: hypothetical protein A4E47_00324 [Methanosaeta sp. PtaU1.Bin028]|nr:MAG: hypothetical protein A4E47_00324 [Methanosaeta sp. PtaU1.Bin028]
MQAWYPPVIVQADVVQLVPAVLRTQIVVELSSHPHIPPVGHEEGGEDRVLLKDPVQKSRLCLKRCHALLKSQRLEAHLIWIPEDPLGKGVSQHYLKSAQIARIRITVAEPGEIFADHNNQIASILDTAKGRAGGSSRQLINRVNSSCCCDPGARFAYHNRPGNSLGL